MTTVEAVRDRILQLCEQRNMSINKLASVSALPPSSVKNILYGKSQNPKLLTIKMLCDGLDITLGEFFNAPVFDGLEQAIKGKEPPEGYEYAFGRRYVGGDAHAAKQVPLGCIAPHG